MDAYKGVDAKGKIAVVFGNGNMNFPPRGISRVDLGKQGEDYMNPFDYARKVGVVGLIVIPDYPTLSGWDLTRSRLAERGSTVVAKFQQATITPLPMIFISPQVANLMFAGERQTANNIFNSSYGNGLPTPFALNETKKVSMSVVGKNEIVPTQNVVAVWEGSDPV